MPYMQRHAAVRPQSARDWDSDQPRQRLLVLVALDSNSNLCGHHRWKLGVPFWWFPQCGPSLATVTEIRQVRLAQLHRRRTLVSPSD